MPEQTAMQQLTINAESLPNELLIQITSYLDCEAPSASKFSHEPSPTLTTSGNTSLKDLSRVCWRWRRIVLPILFRYSKIELDTNPQWVPVDARLIDTMQTQLTKLSSHEMQIYQRMRSKFKSSAMFAFDEMFDDLLINLCRIQDGDDFLKSLPYVHWLPHLTGNFTDFSRFVEQYDLKRYIKSVVVFTEREYELRHIATADAPLRRAVTEVWSQLFSSLDPTRIVVGAPPTTMAGLLDAAMLSSDGWAFNMKLHYIELIQDQQSKISAVHSSNCASWGESLVYRRPWTHLSYNEGSSITAYSTYEYHLKQSPKMLYIVLHQLARVQNCCSIRSFAFTSVFPFSTNMECVIKALGKIPTLTKVQFQLAPGPENNLLSSPKRMGRAQPHDLWLEWNESYQLIATFLRLYNFSNGAEFSSIDCREHSLAEEVEEYVQRLQHDGIGWRKIGVGRWVRDHALDGEWVEPDQDVA
ncbi:hypothetical protein GQ43DRAFT_444390 [Delitschia confertaspora ATCC 74209]|uniref:F-box domain-containing protein n=1 Tax=Delitschia confertaspora ATCC 74209 TaxID=1513339 RepID=A0A9P4JDS8_9PLEO|nr:hypothetical protein GQ43DRAFT_444390 [Delitschia confertaspora ATCC 74209]